MKILASLLITAALTTIGFADIHQPPAADQGPTRKLSRGVANVAFGSTEISTSIGRANNREGNHAALTYGVADGVGKTLKRLGFGIYEIVSFPFPTHKGKYSAPYKSRDVWGNAGLTEFPDEIGSQTKYQYGRNND